MQQSKTTAMSLMQTAHWLLAHFRTFQKNLFWYIPAGSSTQYLRSLVPKSTPSMLSSPYEGTIKCIIFIRGLRRLQNGFGPSGHCNRYLNPASCRPRKAASQVHLLLQARGPPIDCLDLCFQGPPPKEPHKLKDPTKSGFWNPPCGST